MNTFKNVHILNHCWSCDAVYDRTHADANERNVKCEKCGGFVVTPSGKVQTEIVPATKCFLFDDGENHWIAADSQEEAEHYFVTDYLDDENDYTVREVPLHELRGLLINDDETCDSQSSLYEIMCSLEERVPTAVASSVW